MHLYLIFVVRYQAIFVNPIFGPGSVSNRKLIRQNLHLSRNWGQFKSCLDTENCIMLISWCCPFKMKKMKMADRTVLNYTYIYSFVPFSTLGNCGWTVPLSHDNFLSVLIPKTETSSTVDKSWTFLFIITSSIQSLSLMDILL